MTRLRRSDPTEPGIRRRRHGRGFSYVWPDGTPVDDLEVRRRIKALVLPPAWTDVWICTDPDGHLQAIGTDAAGRRQYRYHDAWRRRRDRAKFRRLEGFGRALPTLRDAVDDELDGRGFGRERVLAGTLRMLDVGALRVGNEDYAKQNGSYGLTTLRRDHLTIGRDRIRLHYTGKSGVEQRVEIADHDLARLLDGLRRAHAEPQLWAWRDRRAWHQVRSADVNARLHELLGDGYTSKDFRTWHATLLAAETLADHDPAQGKQAVRAAYRAVAERLGNTPAVARSSYIDPRVVDQFLDEGRTIDADAPDPEAALLDLLAETEALTRRTSG
jgi:DNA topoisomerase IB